MALARDQEIWEDVRIPSTCYMCTNACSILVRRVNGVVVKIEGDPNSPQNVGKLCAKGNAAIMGLYSPHRLTVPLRRTNPAKGPGVDPGWEEISWEEALEAVAERLRKIHREDPRKLMISTFDTRGGFRYIGESFLAAFGSPNATLGSSGYFCGNNLHVMGWLNHGTFCLEPDIDHCRYLILIGCQFGAGSNFHTMSLGARFAEARRRGMKLVVVDPVCTPIASKANEWIPIRPGTDGALALGMLNVLLNELGIYDAEFLREHTNAAYLVGPDGRYVRHPESGKPLVWDFASPKEYDAPDVADPALLGAFEIDGVTYKPGFQLLKEHVAQYPPEKVAEITTVPAEVIRRIAREYGAAAGIGSTIVLDGVEFPWRPACVDWYRGPNAHKHGMSQGIAIQLLNTVIGAVDVPGGHLGISGSGPGWSPEAGPDGLLVPSTGVAGGLFQPYPLRKVKRPTAYEATDLFPLACYSAPMIPWTLRDPARFGLDYELEMLIVARTNPLMSTVNPGWLAEAYARIPFIVAFANVMEATSELADIVFPDTHFLERMDFFPLGIFALVQNATHWYWGLRQPVSEPPAGVRPWVQVLFDLADRIGILPDCYRVLNTKLALKEPYLLDPEQKYGFEEIGDRWCKSKIGPDRGLEWFKRHGVHKVPKDVRHIYQTPFLKARIPLYHEFFIQAGEDVRRVTGELGLAGWETEDYEPLPHWRPCPAYEAVAAAGPGAGPATGPVTGPVAQARPRPGGERDGGRERNSDSRIGDFDLFLINYKAPYHNLTSTYDNAWLDDLTDSYPDTRTVLINTATAKRKGLREGDAVIVESTNGRQARAVARVVETVHPETAAVMSIQGHWIKGQPTAKGKGVHWNSLLEWGFDRIDKVSAAQDACVRVRIVRDGGA
ncbi:MAG: molybdopterin-dependent oxidoreductase [Firmicutes bacterium]|nr:molybdopterin-dependent oxidoreductase [Bacillota bacterium]